MPEESGGGSHLVQAKGAMMRWLLVVAIVVCFGISLKIQANVPAALAGAGNTPAALADRQAGSATKQALPHVLPVAGEIVRKMTYGPGEDERRLLFEQNVESRLVERGFGDPERVNELADEGLRRTGAHALNIVAWLSVVALIAMLFGKGKAKPSEPPDAAE